MEGLVLAKAINKDGEVTLGNLSLEEKQRYEVMASSIDEKNPNSIINFASDLQRTLSSQSDSFLKNVRKSDSGEVGGLINDLLVELNYVDVDELDAKGFKKFLKNIPILGKMVMNVENMFVKYDKITNNIEGISKKVNSGIINSTKDNAVLQTIFDSNVNNIKSLEDYIISGNIRYEQSMEELREMEANPDAYEDFVISDKRDFATRLDRRLADLKVVRLIMMQSLPQIRLVQSNNVSIAEKAQTILTTTLPVWKNQLSLAVAMYRQKQNIEVQKKVSETTENILRKNAAMLGQNTRDVAKANEQTIVSGEVLRDTQRQLIDSLNEVKRIQEEGTASRRQLDTDLQSLETELRNNIKGS